MRKADALAVGAILVAAAARFHAYLAGGVLSFRDAGYWFTPWREALARCLRAGELPLWNDWASCGRAMAANPNAAAFFPVTPLVVALGPTGVALVNLALVLVLFYAALRLLELAPAPAAAGTLALLFAGVFQSVPVFFGMQAALAPLALSVAAMATLDPADVRGSLRRSVAAGAGLGLSFLGGEPVVTALGGLAVVLVVAWPALLERQAWGARVRSQARQAWGARVHSQARGPLAPRRLGYGLLAAVLGLGLSAVQLDPAIGELSRSYRGEGLAAEHGALFWSVRPARVLTLLEPRLTGDPFAEDDLDYWGAGAFDAGNAYFYDLALGVIPLALALASWPDPRGRGALLLAAVGILLASGRHLPLTDVVMRQLTFFRYPEKAWLLPTLALPAAVAVCLSSLRERLGAVRLVAAVLAVPLAALWLLAVAAPGTLRSLLWGLGLGAGPATAERVASAVAPPLLLGALSLALVALLCRLVERGAVSLRTAAIVVGALALLDGARRVAGSCPAGAPDTYRRATPALEAVKRELGGGRFYDDGADVPRIARRRALEAGGIDPLRPLTGVFHGIRYAGENDIDRMTPREVFEWARETARLPWGEAKVRRLRSAGVTVARTEAPGPDPAGVETVFAGGGEDPVGRGDRADPVDRILRIEGARPEFSVVPRGDVHRDASRASQQVLQVRAPEGGLLVVARSWDPSWLAAVNGAAVPTERVDGFLTGVRLPRGQSTVAFRYRNHRLLRGALLTGLTALAMAVLLFRSRRHA